MVSISLNAVWEPVLHVIIAHGMVLVRQCATGTSAVKVGTPSFLLFDSSQPLWAHYQPIRWPALILSLQISLHFIIPRSFTRADRFSVIPISPLENMNSATGKMSE